MSLFLVILPVTVMGRSVFIEPLCVEIRTFAERLGGAVKSTLPLKGNEGLVLRFWAVKIGQLA